LWPEEALVEVAHSWMTDVNLTDDIKDVAVVSCFISQLKRRLLDKNYLVETRGIKGEFASSIYEILIFSDCLSILPH